MPTASATTGKLVLWMLMEMAFVTTELKTVVWAMAAATVRETVAVTVRAMVMAVETATEMARAISTEKTDKTQY